MSIAPGRKSRRQLHPLPMGSFLEPDRPKQARPRFDPTAGSRPVADVRVFGLLIRKQRAPSPTQSRHLSCDGLMPSRIGCAPPERLHWPELVLAKPPSGQEICALKISKAIP